MRCWLNAFNYLSSFGQKLHIDKVGQNIGYDYGKRNTLNAHKREVFYKAARDLRVVHSILQSSRSWLGFPLPRQCQQLCSRPQEKRNKDVNVPDNKSRNIPEVVLVRRWAVGVLGIGREGWVG